MYVSDLELSELGDDEFGILLSEFQSAIIEPASASVSRLAILLVALFAILIVILCIVTASVFFR